MELSVSYHGTVAFSSPVFCLDRLNAHRYNPVSYTHLDVYKRQTVCASYANCRSCSPFTNIPQSGSVVETVFSAVSPPLGSCGSLSSSSSASIGFFPSFSRSALTSRRHSPVSPGMSAAATRSRTGAGSAPSLSLIHIYIIHACAGYRVGSVDTALAFCQLETK